MTLDLASLTLPNLALQQQGEARVRLAAFAKKTAARVRPNE